ncbi:MAG: DnaB helicase C-terminal domain-containing protein [Alphaproteobacteria bacterium]|nr:DnaB helicase C-terminal domain-containing protein [Alphaproteobacteria bacterium]
MIIGAKAMHFINEYLNNVSASEGYILECLPCFSIGDVSIIASRPGMGKTTFMLQVVLNYATDNKNTCYVFSLKESTSETEKVMNRISDNKVALNQLSIKIIDRKNINIDDFEPIITSEMKNGIIFIDSLESIKSPSYRRTLSKLKRLAIAYNLKIFISANLSRKNEAFIDKPTLLPEFKYFYIADTVLLLYRKPFDNPEKSNEVDLIIAKSRDGNFKKEKLILV